LLQARPVHQHPAQSAHLRKHPERHDDHLITPGSRVPSDPGLSLGGLNGTQGHLTWPAKSFAPAPRASRLKARRSRCPSRGPVPLSRVRCQPRVLDVWPALAGPAPYAEAAPGGWTGGMSGSVFIGDQVLLEAGFDAARCQLGRLARDGVLQGTSEHAYASAMTALMKAAGPAAGRSRLAAVKPADLAETADCARLGLRWEATGPGGGLFPALDADLTLTPASKTATLLALAGVYRLPDPAGTGLDPAVARRIAEEAIGSFLSRLACAVLHPAGTAGPGQA
jgi:hypothetical protein